MRLHIYLRCSPQKHSRIVQYMQILRCAFKCIV